ncbi:MAG: hypothetical protein JNM63_01680 [Spirochaetia bacterium]|nr:hypothetical protein [Spirochaetia bacterium]
MFITRLNTVILSAVFFLTCLSAEPVKVSVKWGEKIGVSQFEAGITLTHVNFDDPKAEPGAVERAKVLVTNACRFQNQHIMGWGVGNPNPSPDVYDFAALDKRVALMRSMGAEIVITLCAAPDWMKGLPEGATDWSKIEKAPLPEHYADFAKLSAKIAQRFPDVKYFQVWNEMKGFYISGKVKWDAPNYTKFYNLVYDALKAVNPKIQVGGLYLILEGTGSKKSEAGEYAEEPLIERDANAIRHWVANMKGADFICFDRSLAAWHDPLRPKYTAEDLLPLTGLTAKVVREVKAMTDLPIWFSEYYALPTLELDVQNAALSSVTLHLIASGAAKGLLWNPMQGEANLKNYLFTDTRKSGGAQPVAFYASFKAFNDLFKPGTDLYSATSSSPMVEVIAGKNGAILINKNKAETAVVFDGKALALQPLEVRVIPPL